MKKGTVLFFFFLGIPWFMVYGQTQLERRGKLGMRFDFKDPGARVSRIDKESVEYKAGIRQNDIILKINREPMNSYSEFLKLTRRFYANTGHQFEIATENGVKTIDVVFPPVNLEEKDGLKVEYSHFKSSLGHRVRTIITKPVDSDRATKYPAILFVQWLSCSSVESRGDAHGFSNLIWGLSRNGYLVQRVEKYGVGDSQGPDCSELDFNTEVGLHREALSKLMERSDVDPNRIVVLGGSLGSNIAAILAQGNPNVKAVVFAGGYYKTWQERLLDFERRKMSFQGKTPAVIYDNMLKFSRFYAAYFGEKKKPSQILDQHPDLYTVWPSGRDYQYGRPIQFYWQLNDTNMGAIWDAVEQPILAIYSEYDWIMDKEDSETIIKSSSNPFSKMLTLPQTDHNLYSYDDEYSIRAAFKKRSRVPNKTVAGQIVPWLENLSWK